MLPGRSGVNLLHMPSRLLLADRGLVLAESLRRATSIRARMRGLLGGPGIEPGEGLLLSPCKQVHTFGMRFPIDVVFCDRTWRVTHVVRGMRPQRVSRVQWRARHAIELSAGTASGIERGDRLLLDEPGL